MKQFIDTAEAHQIKQAWDWGIIDGVTTNPGHVVETGNSLGETSVACFGSCISRL